MNRTSLLSLFVVAGATAVLLAGNAQSQSGVPKNQVVLQPSTPGTSQSGHLNITGTARAGQFVGGGAGITGVNADTLDGLNSTQFLQGVPVPLTLTGNNASYIIRGENASNTASSVAISAISTATTGATYGVYGVTTSNSGAGVFGNASNLVGSAAGVYGTGSSTTGGGVFGEALSTSGSNYGGFFRSVSPNGRAVWGGNYSTSGFGYAGYFETASQSGRAVYGVATANTVGSTGGWFEAGGIGVAGRGLSPTGLTYGVFGVAVSPEGTGVFGSAPSTTGFSRGGRFEVASPDGIALVATSNNTSSSNQPAGHFRNLANSGNNWGVLGETQSGTGVGVSGYANATSGGGYGVYGRSSGLTGFGTVGVTTNLSGASKGVFGQSASTEGTGVSGIGMAGTGISRGVEAITNSSAGQALYAECTATGGVNYAGYFKNPGLQGHGVWVESTGDSGRGLTVRATGRLSEALRVTSTHPDGPNQTGIFVNASSAASVLNSSSLATNGNTFSIAAYNYSPAGTAVWASNEALTGNTIGIFGRVDSINGIGIEGQAPGQPTAYGVFSFGNMGANGLKSFVIDHPLDPANKTLKHFCTEGEQPLNVYSGNIRTDQRGYATVELPDYFEEINRDVRYQLTVIDDSDDFVMVKVSQPIKNNRFIIRSSQPNTFVSWRVEGVRNDAWVRRVGAEAVSQKPQEMRGRYYDPESYGYGREQSIGYRQPKSSK